MQHGKADTTQHNADNRTGLPLEAGKQRTADKNFLHNRGKYHDTKKADKPVLVSHAAGGNHAADINVICAADNIYNDIRQK